MEEPWAGMSDEDYAESAPAVPGAVAEVAGRELDPFVHADPYPGPHCRWSPEVGSLRRALRRERRKAKAANAALRESRRRHAADVALVFNAALAAELEGIALPVSVMPDITGLEVEGLGMGWKSEGRAVREWIEAHG